MKKGFNLSLILVFVMLLVVAMGMVGCGDGSLDEDPTNRLPDNGAIDESECREACDKVAGCINETDETAGEVFALDCKLDCNQSGHFDTEALKCIKTVDNCDDLFSCGFEY